MRGLNNCVVCLLLSLFPVSSLWAQEVQMTEMASLEQVYGEQQLADLPMAMNDMGLDNGGYVLYEAEITSTSNTGILEVENIRDYAVVYIDGNPVGGLTDEKKALSFPCDTGKHLFQIYLVNIARSTCGPEF